MSWTPDQLTTHPKFRPLLKVNTKLQSVATKIVPAAKVFIKNEDGSITFTVPGVAVGKPTMTHIDVWKKRPCVLRYRDYCDRIRAAAPPLDALDVYAIEIHFFIALPASYSKKEKVRLLGKMHRVKFDWDNGSKAVCDAIFKQDSSIGDGRACKWWCAAGDERTEITLWFLPKLVIN